jgi:hypothetical protein
VILQSFKSFFTDSSQVWSSSTSLSITSPTYYPATNCCHRGPSLDMSKPSQTMCHPSTGVTPNLSHMSLFWTRSLPVWSQSHRSMHISPKKIFFERAKKNSLLRKAKRSWSPLWFLMSADTYLINEEFIKLDFMLVFIHQLKVAKNGVLICD